MFLNTCKVCLIYCKLKFKFYLIHKKMIKLILYKYLVWNLTSILTFIFYLIKFVWIKIYTCNYKNGTIKVFSLDELRTDFMLRDRLQLFAVLDCCLNKLTFLSFIVSKVILYKRSYLQLNCPNKWILLEVVDDNVYLHCKIYLIS